MSPSIMSYRNQEAIDELFSIWCQWKRTLFIITVRTYPESSSVHLSR